MNIEPLAILGRYQSGIDLDVMPAKFLPNLRFDRFSGALVVLVKKKVRMEFFFGEKKVFEQFPPRSLGSRLAVVLLGYAPVCTRRPPPIIV